MYEVFEHTADLGLRVRAAELNSLFAEAGRGLSSLIVSDLESVLASEQVDYRIEGAQTDYLLLDWLNELLFTYESKRLLLVEFDVRFDETGLSATARGELADPQRHDLDHEIKAITYHGLRVDRVGDGWEAEVIVDI